jgi:methylamine--corrinoid protein Co-methyltransferase
MEEKDFDKKIIAQTSKKILKKYEFKFDPENIVPDDDELADRLFQAGLELAVEAGMYCQSTRRRMLWTKEELEEGLRWGVDTAQIGRGNDAVTLKTRRPEENSTPIIVGGAYGIPMDEELYLPNYKSYAQEGVIDVMNPGTLETVYGHPAKAASPWEVLSAWREFELGREACEWAGRPGIGKGCVENSPTPLGGLAGTAEGAFTSSDWHHVSTVSEFKTNYHLLSLTAQFHRTNALMENYYNPIYGGYHGGAEGIALAVVAGQILIQQTYAGTTITSRPDHPFWGCNTTPELLWAMSLAGQAMSRNTRLITGNLVGSVGGPGTKTMLYEHAAFAITTSVSGQAEIQASHTASGKVPNHTSGLDAKIVGEVAHAVAGMKRPEANDLVKKLILKYKDDLDKAPIGLPFDKVYDIKTIRPTKEWAQTYREVKEDLIGMGIPLDRLY